MAGVTVGCAIRRNIKSQVSAYGLARALAGLCILPFCSVGASAQSLADLGRMSIEELSNIQITSVSRQAQPLSEAAASVYVITNEQIRMSGAHTLPEALRLAPNLLVARVNASNYSISARGFNTTQASNKILVLVDGRSIYTPLHGGVFWDQQQVMMEDVERIEVISGPGGTLWGANAVNGVINIITRSAQDTTGGSANGYMGTQLQRANLRFGGAIGDDAAYRLYGQATHQEDTDPETAGAPAAADDWSALQAGFRFDWTPGADNLTVKGDIFRNKFFGGGRASGGNAQLHWIREFSSDSALSVQTYYDRVNRSAAGTTEYVETLDAELQHNFSPAEGHQIVWGGGYRHYHENFDFPDGTLFYLLHPDGKVELGNVYLQDSVALGNDISLTLGSKFEYSNYTGFEYLPSAHLAWQISKDALLWAAVSRAARTPSRIDRELKADGFVVPASDFDAEELIAYEVGYRGSPASSTSFSISLYYHDYNNLRALTLRDDGAFQFGNVLHGQIYGLEAWGDYEVVDWWRLEAGLNILQKDLKVSPPGITASFDQHVGNDPSWQGFLRTTMDLSRSVDFYAGLRYIDDLPDPALNGYIAADARLGWSVTDKLLISVSASNIFGNHVETATAEGRQLRRNLEVGANWRF